MDKILLIFYLWPARRRARAVALAEALSLLGDLHARASEKGPLSEQGGLFWIRLPAENLEAARVRLARSGYTAAVDWLEPVSEPVGHKKRVRGAAKDALQWHHRWYRRHRLFEEDPEVVREGAPDRRTFLLETSAGDVRPVQHALPAERTARKRPLAGCCPVREPRNPAPQDRRTLLSLSSHSIP